MTGFFVDGERGLRPLGHRMEKCAGSTAIDARMFGGRANRTVIGLRCGDVLVEDSALLAVERIEMMNEERCFSSGGARDGSLGQARFRAQPQVMCKS